MKKAILASTLLIVLALVASQTDVSQSYLASFELLSGPYLPPDARPA